MLCLVAVPLHEGGVAERSELGVGEAENPLVDGSWWFVVSPYPSPALRAGATFPSRGRKIPFPCRSSKPSHPNRDRTPSGGTDGSLGRPKPQSPRLEPRWSVPPACPGGKYRHRSAAEVGVGGFFGSSNLSSPRALVGD